MGFCPSCGQKITESDTQFCMNCGYRVGQTTQVNSGVNQNMNMNNGMTNNYQNQGYPQQANTYTNGWGIAGFVCSIIALLCCGWLVFAGLPMSIVGFVDSKKHNGVGKGLSLAGIIISGISLAFWLFWILLFAAV